MTRRFAPLALVGLLSVAACGSSDSTESGSITSGASLPEPNDEPVATAESDAPEPGEQEEQDDLENGGFDTTDPDGELAPPSRRTTLDDVDLLDSADNTFPRAAVPVDAYASTQVMNEPTDADAEAVADSLATADHLVVEVIVETCTLASVWALPNPGQLVVGYEEEPGVDCIRSVPRTVFFVIPVSGVNSEGAWDYADDYEVTLQRRVG